MALRAYKAHDVIKNRYKVKKEIPFQHLRNHVR
jgi:hypothetical protein